MSVWRMSTRSTNHIPQFLILNYQSQTDQNSIVVIVEFEQSPDESPADDTSVANSRMQLRHQQSRSHVICSRVSSTRHRSHAHRDLDLDFDVTSLTSPIRISLMIHSYRSNRPVIRILQGRPGRDDDTLKQRGILCMVNHVSSPETTSV
jgi:hypothetical protein